jgi:ornithine carbamoyltransferase
LTAGGSGEEVAVGVMDRLPRRIFDHAANRLHAQKGLVYLLIG